MSTIKTIKINGKSLNVRPLNNGRSDRENVINADKLGIDIHRKVYIQVPQTNTDMNKAIFVQDNRYYRIKRSSDKCYILASGYIDN
jgi:hypothetical protein